MAGLGVVASIFARAPPVLPDAASILSVPITVGLVIRKATIRHTSTAVRLCQGPRRRRGGHCHSAICRPATTRSLRVDSPALADTLLMLPNAPPVRSMQVAA